MKQQVFHTVVKKALVVTLFSLMISESFGQQAAQFSQYMFNGLVLNPAYAGSDETLNLTFIGRQQWAGIDNAPSTQTFSAHTLIKAKHVGVGLNLVNDKIGVHRNLNVMSSYSYRVQVEEKSYLSFGVQAGIHSTRSDYNSILRDGVTDPGLANVSVSKTSFDFGAGVYFHSPRVTLGFSAPTMLPQTIQLNDTASVHFETTNFFLLSRYKFSVSEAVDLQPGVLLKYLSNVPLSFDVNLNMIYREVLTLGLSYRRKESVDFLLKAQATPQLQVGYAYDYPMKSASVLGAGSHELMVSYLFRYPQSNTTSPR